MQIKNGDGSVIVRSDQPIPLYFYRIDFYFPFIVPFDIL
jgi:hypothetical protein